MHDFFVRPSDHPEAPTHRHDSRNHMFRRNGTISSPGFADATRRADSPVIRLAKALLPWISTLALLLWWFLATRSPAGSRPLPSPGEVLAALGDLNAEGILWPSIGVSLGRVAAGLALGLVFAVPLGVLAGASRLGLTLVDKPVHMLRAIPFPALAPLLIVWLGIDETMKIVLIAVGVFGLIYVNLRDAVRGLDPRLIELAKAYRLTRGTLFRRILLPGALPGFMTGLRFALTVAWIALVTCETVNAQTGVGYLLARSQQFYRTDQMMLCIVLYAMLGLACEALVGAVERALIPWRNA